MFPDYRGLSHEIAAEQAKNRHKDKFMIGMSLHPGESFKVIFSPEAVEAGRSLNIRRESGLAFHLIVRPTLGAAVINDCIGGDWGEAYHLPLLSTEMVDPLIFLVSLTTAGAIVRIDTEREICFPRWVPVNEAFEWLVPHGISVERIEPKAASSSSAAALGIDVVAWLASEAAGSSVAEISGFLAQRRSLSAVALEHGALAATLVEATNFADEKWASLQTEIGRISRSDRLVKALSASWADCDFAEQVGAHDIVFCHGVLSQVPDPIRFLLELRSMTRRYCYLSVQAVPEVLTGRDGPLDLRISGAIFLPSASPDVLQVLQEQVWLPNTAPAASSDWIRTGDCNPHLQWWVMTRRYVEVLVELAGFKQIASVLADDMKGLELLLDARGTDPWLLPRGPDLDR